MTVLGLPSGVVRLAPHDPQWHRLFVGEKTRLYAGLGDLAIDIQHIGSTSIPGMPAKPILDIAVAVDDFEEAARCIPSMERLGYVYRGENGIPRRHYFVKGEPRTHHVHMVEIESVDWTDSLRFRDYLTEHAEAARAYAELKQELAQRHAGDRVAYQAGKDAFIKAVLNSCC